MTVAAAAVLDNSYPRIGPPFPEWHLLGAIEDAATLAGLTLHDWQRHALGIATGQQASGAWEYPEVCIVVARQNGKTTLLIPRIIAGLFAGERILHTAQDRIIPREVFLQVADVLSSEVPDQVRQVRMANGQETIRMANGGRYTIIAPRRGVRGHTADLLIMDEVREFESFDFVSAARPTLTAAPNPQTIYLSNAGSDISVVLNELRRRGLAGDPGLAYLEWSADPDRDTDDPDGWLEANPSLGLSLPWANLETAYSSLPPAAFETEHLCRWVVTMARRPVAAGAWEACQGRVGSPQTPVMAISVAPDQERATAVLAWPLPNGHIALTVAADVHGDPLDLDKLGEWLREKVKEWGVDRIAFDPWTDADLARYLDGAKPVTGQEYANACARFAATVEAQRLRHDEAEAVGIDLEYTARKDHAAGTWYARPAGYRPTPAALAAIRAVWLATVPRHEPVRIV